MCVCVLEKKREREREVVHFSILDVGVRCFSFSLLRLNSWRALAIFACVVSDSSLSLDFALFFPGLDWRSAKPSQRASRTFAKVSTIFLFAFSLWRPGSDVTASFPRSVRQWKGRNQRQSTVPFSWKASGQHREPDRSIANKYSRSTVVSLSHFLPVCVIYLVGRASLPYHSKVPATMVSLWVGHSLFMANFNPIRSLFSETNR